MKGLFVFDASKYTSPNMAHAADALHCVDGWVNVGDVGLDEIDNILDTTNKALTFAGSPFTACVVNGALWSSCLPNEYLRDYTLADLHLFVSPRKVARTLFTSRYEGLAAGQWHRLRDLLPFMFDLLNDTGGIEGNPDLWAHIQTATSLLAGSKVDVDAAVDLDLFIDAVEV